MSGTIYLIGGGEIRDGDTQAIDEDILSLAPKGSTFVFFGFAAPDSTDYADTVTSVYGGKYDVVVPTEAKGRDFAINAIKSAAVIYLGGGNTEQLLRVFAQWGLVEYLHAAIDRGVHIAGMSAGAQALSTWYVQEDSDIFELRKGWGMVPVGVLVHANPAAFDKAKLLWSDNGMAGTYPFVAVGEGAAWRMDTLGATEIGLGNIWTIAGRN
ncbi:MAG TPA: Type 1 glutamine amidotransferase-like domain-containing protein [Candidatus Saccharimonadales bacterium]|nr:Type 1 glutamine amidotransferase-like domain-containing protein [Candidatus Saccharimonadales bacterium]